MMISKKIGKKLKRVISVVLCLTMLLSTSCLWEIFGLIASADVTVSQNSLEDAMASQSAYAPETIYTKPGASTFEYFATHERKSDGSGVDSKATSAAIYFNNKDATETKLFVNKVYENNKYDTTNFTSSLNLNIEDVSTISPLGISYNYTGEPYNTATVVSSGVTSIYYNMTQDMSFTYSAANEGKTFMIEWVVYYKIAGEDHYSFMYTGIYVPSLAQAGIVSGNDKCRNGMNSQRTHQYSFITGAQAYSGGNYKSLYTSNVVSTTAKTAPLIEFLGYGNNSTDYTFPTTKIYEGTDINYTALATGFSSLANGGVAVVGGYAGNGNGRDATHTYNPTFTSYGSFNGVTKTVTAPTGKTTVNQTGAHSGSEEYNVTTGVAYLNVDISRYTNYKEIPNLKVGWAQLWFEGGVYDNYLDTISSTSGISSDEVVRSSIGYDNDDGWCTTRGVYRLVGNIQTGNNLIEFENYIAGQAGSFVSELTVIQKVALSVVTVDKSALRNQYYNALNTCIDYTNMSKSSVGLGSTYATYYSELRSAAESLCDPTRVDKTQAGSTVKNADTYNSAIASSIGKTLEYVYFNVPETIYLTRESSSATTINFVSVLDQTLVKQEDGEYKSVAAQTVKDISNGGMIQFYYPAVDTSMNVTITATCSVSGSSVSYNNTTLTPSKTNPVNTLVTGGSWGSYTSGYITWTATYKDSVDEYVKTVSAKTYVYAPYISAVGAAGRSVHNNYVYSQMMNWWQGVHSYTSAPSFSSWPVNNNSGISTSAYYSGVRSSKIFDPFYNEVTSPTSNVGITDWLSSSAINGYQPAILYGNKNTGVTTKACLLAVTGYTAVINVDKSRFDNLNEIPNLKYGTLVSDFEGHDRSRRYALGLVSGDAIRYYNGYDQNSNGDGGGSNTQNWRDMMYNYSFNAGTFIDVATTGRLTSTAAVPNYVLSRTETVNYAGILCGTGENGTKRANYDAGLFLSCPLQINYADKDALRQVVLHAQGYSFALQERFWKTDSSEWTTYLAVLDAAQNLLTSVDMSSITYGGTSYDVDGMIGLLNNAVGALTNTTTTLINGKGRPDIEYATQTNIGILLNNDATYTLHALGDTPVISKQYQPYDDITFTAENFDGYKFMGCIKTADTETAAEVTARTGNYNDLLASFTQSDTANNVRAEGNTYGENLMYVHSQKDDYVSGAGRYHYTYYYLLSGELIYDNYFDFDKIEVKLENNVALATADRYHNTLKIVRGTSTGECYASSTLGDAASAFRVTPGHTYELSYDLENLNTSGNISGRVMTFQYNSSNADLGSTFYGNATTESVAPGSVGRSTYRFKTDASCYTVRLRFGMGGGAVGDTGKISNVIVRDITQPETNSIFDFNYAASGGNKYFQSGCSINAETKTITMNKGASGDCYINFGNYSMTAAVGSTYALSFTATNTSSTQQIDIHYQLNQFGSTWIWGNSEGSVLSGVTDLVDAGGTRSFNYLFTPTTANLIIRLDLRQANTSAVISNLTIVNISNKTGVPDDVTIPNPTKRDLTWGDSYGKLAYIARTGYNFCGWYDTPNYNDGNGYGRMITSEDFMKHENVHVYSRWSTHRYNYRYDNNNATSDLADDNLTGFDFSGGTPITLASAPTRGYSYSFDMGESSIDGAYDGVTATPATAQSNFIFRGWISNFRSSYYYVYYNAAGEELTLEYAEAHPEEVADSDIKYVFPYAAGGTYNDNFGAIREYNDATPEDKEQTQIVMTAWWEKPDPITLPEAPVWEGHTFLGWLVRDGLNQVIYDAGSKYQVTEENQQDITFTAQWENDDFNVSYDSNEGSSVDSSVFTYGQTNNLNSTVPTKSGCTFLGWAEANNSTTVDYYAGDTISVATTRTWYLEVGKDGTKQLHAVWSEDEDVSNLATEYIDFDKFKIVRGVDASGNELSSMLQTAFSDYSKYTDYKNAVDNYTAKLNAFNADKNVTTAKALADAINTLKAAHTALGNTPISINTDYYNNFYVGSTRTTVGTMNLNHYSISNLNDAKTAINTGSTYVGTTYYLKDGTSVFTNAQNTVNDCVYTMAHVYYLKENVDTNKPVFSVTETPNGVNAITGTNGAVNYVYPGKSGTTYYCYTNSLVSKVVVDVEEFGSRISYPTQSACDVSATKNATGNATLGAVGISNTTYSAYLNVGMGTSQSVPFAGKTYSGAEYYQPQSRVILTSNFTSAQDRAEVTYTITSHDDSYVNNYATDSKLYGEEVNRTYDAGTNYATTENTIKIVVCYKAKSGFGIKATQCNVDQWLNQYHLLRSSGGASNWELPNSNDTLYCVYDSVYGKMNLGSFVYTFRANQINGFKGISEAERSTMDSEAMCAAVNTQSNLQIVHDYIINRNGVLPNWQENGDNKGLGCIKWPNSKSWSFNYYPEGKSYSYVHLIDRWGNVVDEIIACPNLDYDPVRSRSLSSGMVTLEEIGGSGIVSASINSNTVQIVPDETGELSDKTYMTEENYVYIDTGSADKGLVITTLDRATNSSYLDVNTDEDGVLKVRVDDMDRENQKEYTFTLNGYTITLNSNVCEGMASHKFGDWETVKAATCYVKGEEKRVCVRCKKTETREIDYAHEFGDWTVKTTANCNTIGVEERMCSKCKKVETRQTGYSHDFGEWTVKTASTCTTNGVEERKCKNCTATETRNTGYGHAFSAWTVTTEPGCKNEGVESRYCPKCKTTETRSIGYAHNYGDWTVTTNPTCTRQGIETRYCSKCTSTETRFIPASHTMGEWETVSAATCTSKGSEIRRCQKCEYNETRETAKLAHSYTTVVTKPTCTTGGYTTYTCSCGDTYNANIKSKLGHNFGAWIVTEPATVDSTGTETRYCSRCTAYETREISKHSHSYTNVVKQPTCTEQGYTTYTCSCGDTYKANYTDMLPHSYGDWKTTKPATCTSKGEETRTCKNCTATETREIKMLEHSYTPKVTAPTCTEKGYTTYTCSCGKSYVSNYTDALKHDCSAVVTPPTCTSQGYTTHKCKRCIYSYVDDYVPPKSHTDGEWVVTVQATFKAAGSRTLYCKDCKQPIRTEEISKLTHGSVYSVDISDMSLTYKASGKLNPTIDIDTGVDYKVEYTSSNSKAVTVDNNGNIKATKTGSSTITCKVTDKYGTEVTDTCTVSVSYAWWQWIIVIVLFGWIWY